jgi:hypothetical protein
VWENHPWQKGLQRAENQEDELNEGGETMGILVAGGGDGEEAGGDTGRGGGAHWFGAETVDQPPNGEQWKSDGTEETRSGHSRNPRPASPLNKERSNDDPNYFHSHKVNPKAKKESFQKRNNVKMGENADSTAKKGGSRSWKRDSFSRYQRRERTKSQTKWADQLPCSRGKLK